MRFNHQRTGCKGISIQSNQRKGTPLKCGLTPKAGDTPGPSLLGRQSRQAGLPNKKSPGRRGTLGEKTVLSSPPTPSHPLPGAFGQEHHLRDGTVSSMEPRARQPVYRAAELCSKRRQLRLCVAEHHRPQPPPPRPHQPSGPVIKV